MKLVIDIPNYNLNSIQNGSIACSIVLKAVKNGKPYEERPHGEWIKKRLQIDERHFRSFAKCKVCGCEFKPYSFAVKEFDFCPKCGADMRKEGDEK